VPKVAGLAAARTGEARMVARVSLVNNIVAWFFCGRFK
jgi:hypothetical protein